MNVGEPLGETSQKPVATEGNENRHPILRGIGGIFSFLEALVNLVLCFLP